MRQENASYKEPIYKTENNMNLKKKTSAKFPPFVYTPC